MEFLERVRWTNETPAIYANFYYEYARDGANMKYRTKIVIEPVNGQRYFGWQISTVVASEGSDRASARLKENSPSQWSNNIEWTSDWWTVNNKTSGTSSLSIRLYSNSGGRDVTYNYSMYVAPAYASCNQSLKSKTETSITMNWSSDNTCDYLWYSKDDGANWTAVGSINATSGSYTISGLTANAPYNIKTRIRRKDSQLTTDSSVLYVPTYNYPFAETVPNFNIESPVTIGIYNPLGRSCNVTIYGADGSTIKTLTTSSTSTGAILNDQTSITNLYNSIPNAKSGNYKVRVVYGGSTKDNSNGTYTAVQSLCSPTFSDFRFFDDDYDVIDLTGDNQIIVPRYSDVAVIVSEANKAEAQKGATMSKYQIKIGTSTQDITYSSQMDVSGTINDAPSGTIQVFAIDSRGYSTEVVKTASVIKNYTDIQRGTVGIERQNNVGEAVTLTFNGTYWGESFGSVTNSIKNVTYRYKKTTDPDIPESWADGTTSIVPTENNNTYSFSGGIVGDIVGTGFDAAYSYNIEITVYDELSSTSFTTTLGSGSPNMAFVDGGVSFLGKYDESDTTNKFQINGNTKISGNEIVTGNITSSGTTTNGITTANGIVNVNATSGGVGTTGIINMINDTPTTDTYIVSDATWCNKKMGFGVGAGGMNRGIWDFTNNKWTIVNTDTMLHLNLDTQLNGYINLNNSKLDVGGSAPSFTVRAWVRGTGSGSGASFVAGGNIANVSRISQGTYSVTFSTAMPSANYCAVVSCEVGGIGNEITGVYNATANSCWFDCTNRSGQGVDPAEFRFCVIC